MKTPRRGFRLRVAILAAALLSLAGPAAGGEVAYRGSPSSDWDGC